jgi:hypothetical protein
MKVIEFDQKNGRNVPELAEILSKNVRIITELLGFQSV